MASPSVREQHHQHAERAKELYIEEQIRDPGLADWEEALQISREEVGAALTASQQLRDMRQAIIMEGSHLRVYRQITAPPISQDQFRLICPRWSKASERKGRRVSESIADEVSSSIRRIRNRDLSPWIDEHREPTQAELDGLIEPVSYLLACQRFQTLRRNHLAARQENAVLQLLHKLGWKKIPSKLVDRRADLPAKTFMHKTRFATKSRPQEVDVACGLGGTVVLATECKVTNDQTNSVKRVNDVVKKARSWRDHWGSFVITGAVLQGVIAVRDVDRLIDEEIHVFWSHALNEFEGWLKSRFEET